MKNKANFLLRNKIPPKTTLKQEKTQGKKGKNGFGCLKIFLVILSLPFIIIFIGFLVVLIGNLVSNRSDKDILKSYQPSPDIVEIAEKNTLTDKGKATLYRADPRFVDSEAFIKICQTISRGIEALACIAPKPNGGPFDGRQIFLLKIEDPQFEDHKYSAAVHEMLHAAYKKLGSEEKKRLGPLLDQELLKRQDDPHLAAIIEILKTKKSESDIREELHSKFGVEIKELSPELEEYYKQYFKDRSKVVDLFQKGGFNNRVRKMDQLQQEINSFNNKLTDMNKELQTLKNSGEIDKFNSLVSRYNNTIGQYNAKVTESKKVYSEVEKFYQYFNPDYKPPEEKK